MDFRILDIPFCQILYKWLLNQEGTLDLGDLAAVDPILAQSLRQLQQVLQRKRQLEQDPSHTPDSRQLAVESLTLDGMPIEDLGLSFALPGYPEVELKVWFQKTAKDLSNISNPKKSVSSDIQTLRNGLKKTRCSRAFVFFFVTNFEVFEVICQKQGRVLHHGFQTPRNR